MRLKVVGKGFKVTDKLRSHINLRLRFALGRYGPQINTVTVDVSRSVKPREQCPVRCRIRIRETQDRVLFAEGSEKDLYTAVAVAAEKAAWQVEQSALREREPLALNGRGPRVGFRNR
ncbi:MAG: HPF/RaiA family ribosome-associated protein [Nitrospirae bacterium]|nr:HPF/RaiA family ribosome-associated protein [Nitrospirota bacterium]